MPKSMKAFSREQIQTAWGVLVCEIRSVNHRYLETSFRMPDQIRTIEMQMRDLVREQITRGKVEISFRLQVDPGFAPEITINESYLQQVIEASNLISGKLAQTASMDPLDVLQWP